MNLRTITHGLPKTVARLSPNANAPAEWLPPYLPSEAHGFPGRWVAPVVPATFIGGYMRAGLGWLTER